MSEESAYRLYMITSSIGVLMITLLLGMLVYVLIDFAYRSWKESREEDKL